MFSSSTILDRWVDSEETTRLIQGAQKEEITVAARLTGHILNEILGHTHTL
jgi:exopolysaccharide biosynthesis predicted pyruvyltransferase EpsI